MYNQPQSVTLQTAIIIVVKELSVRMSSFSATDITTAIRNKCINGELEIPELEVTTFYSDDLRYDIRHSVVNGIFKDLWKTGVFNPEFILNREISKSGEYYIYTPLQINNVTNPIPVPANVICNSISALRASVDELSRSDATERIRKYLNNCQIRKFHPTLRQVQSAIKRNNVSTGWSCDEIGDIICNCLGYDIDENYD